jgi:cytochrome c
MSAGQGVVLATIGVIVLLAVTAVVSTVGLRGPVPAAFATVEGDPDAGRDALLRYGCAACHAIDGVRVGGGRVGPALNGLRYRRFVAGQLPTTPESLMRFIMDPQGTSPGSAMPDLGVMEAEARDMVAYLATLGGRP